MKIILLLLFLVWCSHSRAPRVEVATKSGISIVETIQPQNTTNVKISPPNPLILQSQRHALIIANGNYLAETGWPSISSLNDVRILRKVLLLKGFPESQITVVRDAGYLEMLKALSDFEKALAPGNVAFLHFSGHGQQIEDDNGDEPDGYDEALVPIDAHVAFVKGVYEGERHIRDDTFGKAITKMRRRLTTRGNLFLTIDACHSGTAIRGFAKSRGAEKPFARPGFKGRGGNEMSITETDDTSKGLASFAAFYAARPHQINYEYSISADSTVGSLSYALSEALLHANSYTTYAGLFEKLRIRMAAIVPNQTPFTEGTLDQEILGGKLKERTQFFEVGQTVVEDGGVYVTLEGGLLDGIYEGSVVALHSESEWDREHPQILATGKVIFSGPLTAVMLLDKKISVEEAFRGKAVVIQKGFGPISIGLKLQLQEGDLKTQMEAKLLKSPFIKLKKSDSDLLLKDSPGTIGSGSLKLLSREGQIVWEGQLASAATAIITEVLEAIENFVKAQFLRGLSLEDPSLRTTFEIIPYQAKIIGGTVANSSPLTGNRIAVNSFKNDDFFKIKIVNHGTRAVYYTLIDIQPDGVINGLIPGKDYQPVDFRLVPGQSYLSGLMRMAPPFGTEVFKLFASEKPLELQPSLESRGGKKGLEGDLSISPLSPFFAKFEAKEEISRGVNVVSPGSLHIHSMAFTISEN